MNTPKLPRDFLLQRHTDATSQLDILRRNALPQATPAWRIILRELFYPNRQIWQALAFVWLGLIAVFLADVHANKPTITTPATAIIAPWTLHPNFHDSLVQMDRHP